MTIKSIAELLAQADATLPDNNTQLISAADVRAMVKDFLDTMSPAYGVVQLTSLAKAVTTTPSKITPFTSALQATAPYYTVSAANGAVTRNIQTAGIAGATDFLIASGGVNGGNNANVVLEIFKNGVATGYKASVTCSGGADVLGFNIAGIVYTAAPGDAEYDLRISGPAGNYTLTNVVILAQAQPVRSFT